MNSRVKNMVKLALIGALYVVLTLVLTPISYGPIQFRIAEALVLTVLFDNRYTFSIVIGTIIANLFSPLGIIDAAFGTIATILSCVVLILFKKWNINQFLFPLIPSILNGLIIGLEMEIIGNETLFYITALEIFASELIILYIGVIIDLVVKKKFKLENIFSLGK